MKMHLISDNQDTLTGLRLVGISGNVVNNKHEFLDSFQLALEDKELAILVITEKLDKDYHDFIADAKISQSLPLITVIPDRHGSGRPQDFITRYIREAIGIKI